MTTIDSADEYGIEVSGKGFVTSSFPYFGLTIDPDLAIISVIREDVEAQVKRVKEEYVRMGCPEVADCVRLVSRTVTVTRGDWEIPMTIPMTIEGQS